jgi:hypothetical protein
LAKQDFIDWVERQGQSLRQKLALPPTQTLDPYKLAGVMKVQIFTPYDVMGFSAEYLDQLLGTSSDSWSAGAFWTPDGRAFVVMNSNHAQTRRHATLMEELSHIHLKHKFSKLIVSENGIAMRDYSKSKETEAYWVGSAALVPKAVLLSAQNSGLGRNMVASNCGVSGDLVKLRENVTGIRLR